MKSAVLDGFKRWKDYSGRTSRAQFWWFYLFCFIAPFISGALSLIFTLIFSLLNLEILSRLSLIFTLVYILIAPVFLAVGVRRMHDVGKSGWFILVPLYNFYLFVQPSFEKGRIPKWILAEKVALGFVAILIVSVIVGLFAGDSDALGGLVFWSIIYLLIRRKNKANKKVEE
jgi:uncharacterized membrane protein YhaH (DUF805 family)